MSIYITTDNFVMGFDVGQEIPAGAVAVPETFTPDHYPFLTLVNGVVTYTAPAAPTLTVDQQIALNTEAIQNVLDTTAQSRQYYDIKSACAYASPTPFTMPPNATPAQIAIVNLQEKSRIEGNALQAWMSLTWATANQYLSTVTAGTNPMPTADQAVAMMPTFTWPD